MLFLSVLLTFLSVTSGATAAFTFPSSLISSIFPHFGTNHKFSQEKLQDLSSLGLPKTGQISSWGNFGSSSSSTLDLVYLSYDQRSITVWNWDKQTYSWKEDEKKLIKTKQGFKIVNVLTGDFNRDGKLDLILMGMQHPGWYNDDKIQILLYSQGKNGTFMDPIELDSSSSAQPIVFDALGTMTSSFLGFPPSSSSSSSTPQLWIPSTSSSNSQGNNFSYSTQDASLRFDYSSHPTGNWNCKFPNPHFNHFLDLNGDCLADLFLTCLNEEKGVQGSSELRYEIWINDKKSGKFVYKRGDFLPKGTRTIGFSDFDRDGTLDMLLTVCPNNKPTTNGDKDCFLQINYNDQIPLCSSSTTTTTNGGGDSEEPDCRDIGNLCVGDDQFSFNLTDSVDNPSMSKFKVSKDLIPDHTLLTSSLAFQGHLPVSPQIGDYNIDGYPDLLLLVSPTNHPTQRIAKLLQSRACTIGSKCTKKEIEKGRRTFELVVKEEEAKGIQELENFKDVETVHWLDLDDDGSLDIVLQRTGQSGAARQINFLKNNWFNDAFFLKAMVLNGACNNWCQPSPDEDRFKPYGSSYSGASFKFTVLDPTGSRRSTQYAQLPFTSYLSLGSPSAYLGLGRTNNYVENLFIGSTRSKQSNHFINLEGVIPNSQVLILPFQSQEAPTTQEEDEDGSLSLWEGNTGEWRKELYLKPGDWIPWVTLVLVTAIIGLGIVVFVLHLNEKREDEVERRARLLSLNFGAL
ncbi:hypothetical protein JCM3765_003122 [Sporobolomyces pararoseus]